MILYPKIYLKNATYLSKELIEKYNIKGIILDVDNTLMDYEREILENVDSWCENLKNEGIKFCIVSNSNNTKKIKLVAEKLKIPYINWAMKPLKIGLNKAQRIMNIEKENIAVIGDQIFTDIFGANRNNMISVLVEPLMEKDLFLTKIKRPFEERIIKKYLAQKGEK